LNFADRSRLNNGLWDKSKIRGVVGIRDAVNKSALNAGRMDDLGELSLQIHGFVS